jgi:O-antigen/teichoic acid export membrane protein
VFSLLYTSAFPSAPDVFRILFWGFLVTLNVEPLVLVLYAQNLPQFAAGLELSKLLVSLGASLLLVPAFSITGAAVAASLGRVVGGLLGVGVVSLILSADIAARGTSRWVLARAKDDGLVRQAPGAAPTGARGRVQGGAEPPS